MWWNDYVGIPFRSHGRDRNGCDCWGLLRMVYSEQRGVALPSYVSEYDDANDRAQVGTALMTGLPSWKPVGMLHAVEGDAILFKLAEIPFHVGIVIGGGEMLHVIKGANACIENYLASRWVKRIEGIYRYV